MAEARASVDKNPAFVGVIRQYPDQMGARAVDVAIEVIQGKKVAKLNPIVPGVYQAASK